MWLALFSLYLDLFVILSWLSVNHDFCELYLFFSSSSFSLNNPHSPPTTRSGSRTFCFCSFPGLLFIFRVYLTSQNLTLIIIFTFMQSIKSLEYFSFISTPFFSHLHSTEQGCKYFIDIWLYNSLLFIVITVVIFTIIIVLQPMLLSIYSCVYYFSVQHFLHLSFSIQSLL